VTRGNLGLEENLGVFQDDRECKKEMVLDMTF
jgi:hypothetical protein